MGDQVPQDLLLQLGQAVEETKGLDQQKLADYMHSHEFETIVGKVKFGADGEWAKARTVTMQFQNIKGNDLAQFRDTSTEVVISPAEYATSATIYPYAKAKR